MDIKIRIEGDDELERQLAVASGGLRDLRPWWPIVVRIARGWFKQQFSSEGEFGGQGWAPLSPGYAAAKAQAFGGRGILHRTGALRRAADDPTRAATATSLTLTIESEIAGLHQEGTSRMPRPADRV